MSLIDQILKGSLDYEDGEMGMRRCIEAYCRDHGIGEAMQNAAIDEALKRAALDAGIPLSVIEGKTKLSDHFSPDYIAERAGKKRGDE